MNVTGNLKDFLIFGNLLRQNGRILLVIESLRLGRLNVLLREAYLQRRPVDWGVSCPDRLLDKGQNLLLALQIHKQRLDLNKHKLLLVPDKIHMLVIKLVPQ